MVPPAVRNESNLRIGGYKSLYDTPITELKRAIRTAGPPQALRLGSAAGAAAPRPVPATLPRNFFLASGKKCACEFISYFPLPPRWPALRRRRPRSP